ncbi:unnamed protein product [Polarella glacialis]|uniref:C3H1-type domain-containing protein n=1 Tax=Polarella glacialis TaxID=89957 RepID=A0A813GKM9_POLGL|nr:unnamed protein product [Polarella glacialis]CAE8698038.1 unnamed protein product [Polarella glacialis]
MAAVSNDASSCAPRMLTPLCPHLPDSEKVPLPPGRLLPSPGSMAHPELCSRPCIHFAAGSCANGSACGYCHLSHTNRSSHLDRRHRDLLRSLSEADRLALLLPALRFRAERYGLAAEAGEVLALLENKAVSCAAKSVASQAWASIEATADISPMGMLPAALRKMSFSTVLGMALRGATGCKNKYEEDLAAMWDQLLLDAVDRMRARLPQAVGA